MKYAHKFTIKTHVVSRVCTETCATHTRTVHCTATSSGIHTTYPGDQASFLWPSERRFDADNCWGGRELARIMYLETETKKCSGTEYQQTNRFKIYQNNFSHARLDHNMHTCMHTWEIRVCRKKHIRNTQAWMFISTKNDTVWRSSEHAGGTAAFCKQRVSEAFTMSWRWLVCDMTWDSGEEIKKIIHGHNIAWELRTPACVLVTEDAVCKLTVSVVMCVLIPFVVCTVSGTCS